MSNVEKIKDALSIVDVLGSYITLQKAGKNYKAPCPFHNEKTPSFSVSPDRGFYYCFGCGAKGDMFTFVEEFEGLDFRGALRVLADKAGISLEQEDSRSRDEREKLTDILEQSVLFFEAELAHDIKAQDYLKKRGLKKETIRTWRIGYAKEGWRNLYEFFIQKNNDVQLLLEAGLVKKKEGGGYYDVFRERIVFPIFDTSGRAVGFSGRDFSQSEQATDTHIPKYLNTPETTVFNKSRLLYGLDKAKTAIRKKDYTIIVEGQMDLLMSHQAGFDNTVATSGTAVTKEHLERLNMISSNIILCFDADEAGVKAAFRTTLLAISIGMEVKVARIDDQKDPADLILKDPVSYKNVVKDAPFAVLFFLDYALQKEADKRKQIKSVREYVFPILSLVTSGMEKDRLASLVAERLSVEKQAVLDDVAQVKAIHDAEGEKDEVPMIETKYVERSPERSLVGIVMWQSSLKEPVCDMTEIRAALEVIVGNEYSLKLFARGEELKDELIFEAEQEHGSLISKQYITDLLYRVEDRYLGKHIGVIKQKIRKAEESNDEHLVEMLMKEFYQLLQEQNKIRKERSGLATS